MGENETYMGVIYTSLHQFIKSKWQVFIDYSKDMPTFCDIGFGFLGANIVQQSSNGLIDISYVSIFSLILIISNLSIVAHGRITGIFVTALITFMLARVCEAT